MAKYVDGFVFPIVVFGWVAFPSKEVRDLANQKVPAERYNRKLCSLRS